MICIMIIIVYSLAILESLIRIHLNVVQSLVWMINEWAIC